MKLRNSLLTGSVALVALVAAMPSFAFAQSAGADNSANIATGIVQGRVINTATGEYVANAEISISGTPIVEYSGDGGNFRIVGVPDGDHAITVRYAGMQDEVAKVSIIGGQVTDVNFELKGKLTSSGNSNSAQTVIVTAVRGGQAKALMERRASMNAKTVVSADNYGILTMGDVGEFMKNMPGVSLDYTEVDATSVRIGGLDPKYSTFTTDGSRMATATSNNNSGRQNSFEQMSITGIDSIELNNTLTASMDADAPGGSINMKSTYAFLRKKRLLRFQLGGVGTSDSTSKKIYFPDDKKHSTIFPSAQFGYADVFMDGRLGVAFNASYNANFVQQDRIQTDWAYYKDGTVLPYQVMWRPGPKLTTRKAANLALDYKMSDDLVLSLRGSYSFYDVEYFNQYTYLTFGTTSKQYANSDSTSTHIVVNPNGTNTRLKTQYSHRYASTPAWVISPKLEYKGNTTEATLRASYSSSQFNFRDNSRGFFQRDDSQLTNIGFTLDRPSEDSNEWTLNQTSGRDWSDPRSFNRDADIGNNVRTAESDAKNDLASANFDFKKKLNVMNVPVILMAGLGARSNDWRTNEGSYQQYQYVGPNNDLSQKDLAAVIPWTHNYVFQIKGFDAGNMNDQGWHADNNYAMYDIFASNPEYFVADEFGNLKRKLDNNKRIEEDIYAAYTEGQWKVGKARFDLGLRYEKTKTAARIADIRSNAEVKAAGYSTSTVEGLLYQYRNGTYSERKGDYDDFFFSGGFKYDFSKKLVGQLSFSQSILRPDYGNLGGVVSINEDNMTVTVPNPELKPEHSTKYFASLQYYLEPSGIVGISAYRLDIKDLQTTGMTVNPEDVGFDGNEYEGYIFRSAQNISGTSTNNGVTFEYDQQLTFLPSWMKGFGLRASYTQVIPDDVRVKLPKNSANWGLRYKGERFDFQLTGNYQSKYRTSALSNTETTENNGILYHKERELWNFSASYHLNDNFDIMVAGRNIFNAPDIIYSNVSSRVQQYSIYGSMWNIGIKGTF